MQGSGQPAITVRFNITRAWAPLGVDRFYQLMTLPGGGYFSQNGFFRVVPGFVVQFGISGNTTLSQQWENANIADDPVVASNVPGTICYATAGPNTRTTQLFVNYGNNSRLDAQGFVFFFFLSSSPMRECVSAWDVWISSFILHLQCSLDLLLWLLVLHEYEMVPVMAGYAHVCLALILTLRYFFFAFA